MNDRKPSTPFPAVVCLSCGDPLPESRAKTRRYCSASCRTTAYNLRASQRLVSRSSPDDPFLPEWALSQSGEVPLLTSTKASLKDVVATLDGLSRCIEAEESALRRDLNRVRTRLAKEDALQRGLVQLRHHVRERDAELIQPRQVLAERNAQLAVVTPSPPAPKTLTIFSASVPDDFQLGLSMLGKQADILRRFVRAQRERGAVGVLTNLADGFDFIHGKLMAAAKSLRQLHHDSLHSPSVTVLLDLLEQVLLPAFDGLYRCVVSLRLTPRSAWLDSLCDITEWMFASFVGFLERHRVSPLYPIGRPFTPTEHEASTAVEDAQLPRGSIAAVVQVGFLLQNKLLRWALVILVAERAVSSSS